MKGTAVTNRRHEIAARGLALVCLLALGLLAGAALAWGEGNSCVDCHSNPRFRVTNPELYNYYQNWQVSAHNEAGVTCVDCHGGNPKATTKAAAHKGAALSASPENSPLNYQNIPKTCAQCHERIYRSYKESRHYSLLERDRSSDTPATPNCVTCHGSVNLRVLNVNTVGEFCATCHNAESGNRPDIPEEAVEVLNNFLSIHRYYRSIVRRANPEQIKPFFRQVDKRIASLTAEWHTFDLDAVRKNTQQLVLMVKEKRNELAEQEKSRKR